MDGPSGSAVVSLAVGVGAALYLLYSQLARPTEKSPRSGEPSRTSRGHKTSTSSVASTASTTSTASAAHQSSVVQRRLFEEPEEDDDNFFDDLSFRGDVKLRLAQADEDVSELEILDDDFEERARRRLPYRPPLTSTPTPAPRPAALAPMSAPSRQRTAPAHGSHTLTPVPKSGPSKAQPRTAPRPGKERAAGRGPYLIRNLNSQLTAKVLGEMTFNPETCRWEGNEEAARIFDQPTPRARPALVSNLGGAMRPQVVKDMVYDPVSMSWLGNDAEADDVFKDIEALPTTGTGEAKVGNVSETAFTITPQMADQFRQSETQHKRLVAGWQHFHQIKPLDHLKMIRDIASKLSS